MTNKHEGKNDLTNCHLKRKERLSFLFLFHLPLPLHICITHQSRHLFESVCVYVCAQREGGCLNNRTVPTAMGRFHCWSLWSGAHRFSWNKRDTERERERGDTSARRQWAFSLSLRYLSLLCFRASSIKYETLRQKEGEWKGRERGPSRAPLNAFEETLRRGASWVRTLHALTHTYTNLPNDVGGWDGKYTHLHLVFFDHFSRMYHKRSMISEIRPKSLGLQMIMHVSIHVFGEVYGLSWMLRLMWLKRLHRF